MAKKKHHDSTKPNPFGAILGELRLELDLNEIELAARSHVSRTTIQRALVSPTKAFRRARLFSLVNALNVPDEASAPLVAAYDALPDFSSVEFGPSQIAKNNALADAIVAAFPNATGQILEGIKLVAEWQRSGGSRRLGAENDPVPGHPYDWLRDPAWPVENARFFDSWVDQFPWHCGRPWSVELSSAVEDRLRAFEGAPSHEAIAMLLDFPEFKHELLLHPFFNSPSKSSAEVDEWG